MRSFVSVHHSVRPSFLAIRFNVKGSAPFKPNVNSTTMRSEFGRVGRTEFTLAKSNLICVLPASPSGPGSMSNRSPPSLWAQGLAGEGMSSSPRTVCTSRSCPSCFRRLRHAVVIAFSMTRCTYHLLSLCCAGHFRSLMSAQLAKSSASSWVSAIGLTSLWDRFTKSQAMCPHRRRYFSMNSASCIYSESCTDA